MWFQLDSGSPSTVAARRALASRNVISFSSLEHTLRATNSQLIHSSPNTASRPKRGMSIIIAGQIILSL
jgi:hypothetical protein